MFTCEASAICSTVYPIWRRILSLNVKVFSCAGSDLVILALFDTLMSGLVSSHLNLWQKLAKYTLMLSILNPELKLEQVWSKADIGRVVGLHPRQFASWSQGWHVETNNHSYSHLRICEYVNKGGTKNPYWYWQVDCQWAVRSGGAL